MHKSYFLHVIVTPLLLLLLLLLLFSEGALIAAVEFARTALHPYMLRAAAEPLELAYLHVWTFGIGLLRSFSFSGYVLTHALAHSRFVAHYA